MAWAAHKRTVLVGDPIIFLVVIVPDTTSFLVRHQVRVLIVRIGQVLTGKGPVQVQELDKVASDGDAGAAVEAGTGARVLLVALEHVVTSEALSLAKLSCGHVVVWTEQVRGGGAVRMGEGHGSLQVCLDGDAEQIAMNVATLQQK